MFIYVKMCWIFTSLKNGRGGIKKRENEGKHVEEFMFKILRSGNWIIIWKALNYSTKNKIIVLSI